VYAQAIVVQDIFGHTLESLRNIKHIFKYGIPYIHIAYSLPLSIYLYLFIYIYLSIFTCLRVVLSDN
jgi:uncharacterized membrane protein YkvI